MHSEAIKRTLCAFTVFLLALSIFLIPLGAQTTALDSRFGVNAFVLNRYETGASGMPLAALQDLRVGWIREEFIWEQIEPNEGQFHWEPYDAALAEIDSAHINVLGILDYSAPWATEDSNREYADKYMPNLDAWERYVTAVVERYGDRIKYWQIWNEPNIITFFRPEPRVDRYIEILKTAYRAIKRHDKRAQVVSAGTSGVDRGYLEEMRDKGAGKYFDIIALHPYMASFAVSPEEGGFLKDLTLSEDIATLFGGKPVWFTEFGWPNDFVEGVSDTVQAEYLVRTYVMSFSSPHIQKLFWYDLRDDGSDRTYREHNFGLLRRDYTKKPAYIAYRNLIKLLEYSSFDRVASFGEDGFYDFRFRKGNDEIRVVWRSYGERTLVVDDIADTRVYDMFGEEEILGNIGTVVESVSSSPLFITYSAAAQNTQ